MERARAKAIEVAKLWLTAACGVAVLVVPGCGLNDLKTIDPVGLGNACQLSGGEPTSPTQIGIGPDSVNCASNVCIRPAMQKSSDTGPLCTQGCESDLDCTGGQTRDPTDASDRRCTSGFSCQIPVPNLAGVSLACQKVCVCRDFLVSGPSMKPPSCP